MSAVETPAVTAAVFNIHTPPSALKHKTTLDIAHFATPSEQQQEYVQFLGDFPREKFPVPG